MKNLPDPNRPKEADLLFTFEPYSRDAGTRLYERLNRELEGSDHTYRLGGERSIQLHIDGQPRPWSEHCARRFAEAINASVYFNDATDPALLALLESIDGQPSDARQISSETDAVVLAETDIFRLAIEPLETKDDESKPDIDKEAIDVTIQYTSTHAGRDEWSVDIDDLTSVETVTYAAEELSPNWKRWMSLIFITNEYWRDVEVEAFDRNGVPVTNPTFLSEIDTPTTIQEMDEV